MRATIQKIKQELFRHRHSPVRDQATWLRSVVQEWFNDHAVHYNRKALVAFRFAVVRHWNRALRRRSHKWRDWLNWKCFVAFAAEWIPQPKILHPWPNQRCRA